MSKLLSYIFLMSVSVGMSVLAMIYGWGLTPKNWWIIGVGVFGHAIIKTMIDALEKEGK